MDLPKKAHPSWEPVMTPLLEDKKWMKLRRFLARESYFYPQPSDAVFNAFDIELHRLRVVMCGQDPYPQPHNAHGIAFSIPDDCRAYKLWPPSLQIIAKNICGTEDVEQIETYFVPNLDTWMHQGVLLINRALTVGSQSHMSIWTWFTRGLIENLNKLDQPIIFYFLGNPAKELSRFVTSEKHYIFESIHPAALAHNPNLQFNGKFKEIGELYRKLYGFELHYTLPF